MRQKAHVWYLLSSPQKNLMICNKHMYALSLVPRPSSGMGHAFKIFVHIILETPFKKSCILHYMLNTPAIGLSRQVFANNFSPLCKLSPFFTESSIQPFSPKPRTFYIWDGSCRHSLQILVHNPRQFSHQLNCYN